MELTDILITATNAIIPIMLLILLGYVLRHVGFLNESFIQAGSKLGFHVCIPCMQFLNVYNMGGFDGVCIYTSQNERIPQSLIHL